MVGLILETRDLNFCNEADPQSEETVSTCSISCK